MKTIVFTILTLLFFAIQMNAQETVSRNFYTEPRFDFYKKTFIIFNEYLNTNTGSFNTTNFRLLYPFGNKALNFRFDLPIVTVDNPGTITRTGLGDIDFSVAYIPLLNDKTGFAVRGKISVPTATGSAFGTGKWTFISTGFFGHYWDSQKQWFSITSLEQQFSFAGQTNRTAVNRTILENDLYYSFQKNWIGTVVFIRYNSELKVFQNFWALEYGRKFTTHFNAYIHPSIGFGPQRIYNYGIETGVLIFF